MVADKTDDEHGWVPLRCVLGEWPLVGLAPARCERAPLWQVAVGRHSDDGGSTGRASIPVHCVR